MRLADEFLGVPQVIAPEEITDPNVDELSVMTYLSQFPKSQLKSGAPLRPKTNPKKARAYGKGVDPSGCKVGFDCLFPLGSIRVTLMSPLPATIVSTVNGQSNPTLQPLGSTPFPYALAFLGLVLGRSGAPDLSCDLGNWERYVITDSSSTFGSVISSGAMTCGTPRNSSASLIASLVLSTPFSLSQSSQSGHKPGAQLSTSAPSAIPSCQLPLKLVMGISGILFWIHPSNRCLGVACTFSSLSSSSSHMGMEME